MRIYPFYRIKSVNASAESGTVRIVSCGPKDPRPKFEDFQNSGADEKARNGP